MTGGHNPLRWALAALTVALIAAAPLPSSAVAQGPQEYDLNLPGAGSGESDSGGSGAGGETTAPTVAPTAPAAPAAPLAPTATTPTTEDLAAGGSRGKRDRNRGREQTNPILATSGVNATAGPQEIPAIKVSSGEGGVPTVALVLASIAAACCILALWRLRFLRELPVAPRPGAQGGTASSRT